MDSIFRTYQTLRASYFDLLSGSNEVKQTLGIGFCLSKDRHFLKKLLESPEIYHMTGDKLLDKDEIIIHNELSSSNKSHRIDIAILVYRNSMPLNAILIEAKSINVFASSVSIQSQLNRYLNDEGFSLLNQFKRFGCSLTKNRIPNLPKNMGSITWESIIRMLNSSGPLSKELFQFLLKINGSMKFYESEVYSIPAGISFEDQDKYPYIYECPNTSKYKLKSKPLYLTFRASGGIMKKMVGLDEIIILNPKRDLEVFNSNEGYEKRVRERVNDYCLKNWKKDLPDVEQQFFILSEKNVINLKHEPRVKRNGVYRKYFELKDILNDEIIEH